MGVYFSDSPFSAVALDGTQTGARTLTLFEGDREGGQARAFFELTADANWNLEGSTLERALETVELP